jgi:hypothetical protein
MDANKPLSRDAMDQVDKVHETMSAAIAILDCVTVLTSLERTPCQEDAEMATGHGFAWGYCTSDDSIPLALHHAKGLVQQIGESAKEALHELSEIRRGGHVQK